MAVTVAERRVECRDALVACRGDRSKRLRVVAGSPIAADPPPTVADGAHADTGATEPAVLYYTYATAQRNGVLR